MQAVSNPNNPPAIQMICRVHQKVLYNLETDVKKNICLEVHKFTEDSG